MLLSVEDINISAINRHSLSKTEDDWTEMQQTDRFTYDVISKAELDSVENIRDNLKADNKVKSQLKTGADAILIEDENRND